LNADWESGLSPEVYHELRVIAHAQLQSQRADATLNTTALVNEAYLKLGNRQHLWQDRKHFYATMARVMRHVTVDLSRKSSAQKRPQRNRLDLKQLELGQIEFSELADLIAIDEALTELGRLDPHLEDIMELRFFTGMSVTEAAELLDCSEATIKRNTRVARAFLASKLVPPS